MGTNFTFISGNQNIVVLAIYSGEASSTLKPFVYLNIIIQKDSKKLEQLREHAYFMGYQCHRNSFLGYIA